MPSNNGTPTYDLLYEYAAYDVAQVRLRYLLRVRMTHNYDFGASVGQELATEHQ